MPDVGLARTMAAVPLTWMAFPGMGRGGVTP